jgi:hypothetical protein
MLETFLIEMFFIMAVILLLAFIVIFIHAVVDFCRCTRKIKLDLEAIEHEKICHEIHDA